MGLSNSGEMQGQFCAGAVNLLLGCAAQVDLSFLSNFLGSQGLPVQSMTCSGSSLERPSHHTVMSSVFRATFVKIVPRLVVARALGLEWSLVPGATPKKPFSGFTAHSLPSSPTRIQAISSPTHSTL